MRRDWKSHIKEHRAFVTHKEDQAILSLLLKRHYVKTYPVPQPQARIYDVTATEAGYCDPELELPLLDISARPQ